MKFCDFFGCGLKYSNQKRYDLSIYALNFQITDEIIEFSRISICNITSIKCISFFTHLQPFQRYVETGRVAKATSGALRGRLLTIVDVINQTTVSSISIWFLFFSLNLVQCKVCIVYC